MVYYVGIILTSSEGKFLIQLRDNNPKITNPGKWGLFGGSSEDQETPQEAIIREIEEELGIKLESLKLKEIYSKDPNFLFFYELNDGEEKRLKLMEGQKIGKFTIKEILDLPNLAPGGTREAFLNIDNLIKL